MRGEGAHGEGEGAYGEGGQGGEREDQDEEFDTLETQLVLGRDPDSLPFFKAAKASSNRAGRGGGIDRLNPAPPQKPTWA